MNKRMQLTPAERDKLSDAITVWWCEAKRRVSLPDARLRAEVSRALRKWWMEYGNDGPLPIVTLSAA